MHAGHINQPFQYAASIYEQLLVVIPKEKDSLLNLGIIYYRAKKYDKAIQFLNQGTSQYITSTH